MNRDNRTFVIVGAGLAGAKAAETLREEGFTGRLVMVGAERERPYERPPLTKGYLRSESPREKVYVHDADFYASREIELITGARVTSLDVAQGRIDLQGKGLSFDRLLLATGAEPRRLSIPGADLDGVHYLRTLADCDTLRARLDAAGRVVVVGAGWIGMEFAASARQRGADVAIVDPAGVPLQRALGADVGAIYRDIHRDHGVELLLDAGVEAFEGQSAVERVRTADGRSIECDFAVVGIGVVPAVEVARAAGIAVGDGIVVDERLITSAPDVAAAGDVATAWHPRYRRHVRLEHWANALNQGPAAARSMLGEEVSYDRIPYFFSDQYDVGMEYSGLAGPSDEVVFRGDVAAREFIAFWLREDRVVAGMNVNIWDVNEHVQALIRSGAAADRARLADPDVPLESIVGAHASPGRG